MTHIGHRTAVLVNDALIDKIEATQKTVEELGRDLDNALSVIERLEAYLDDGYGEGHFEMWAMSNDHQLFDDLLALPARRTNAES